MRPVVRLLILTALLNGAAGVGAPVVLSDLQAVQPSTQGSGGVNTPQHTEKPYVVLVSFDGLRADYLDRIDTPSFRRVMRQGVRAERLIPVFPSKTFPNHYSIATGMFADRHGIVANTFYDPQRDAAYGNAVVPGSVEDGTWYRGEPIWLTAEKQGMVAATCFWVGSEAEIQGLRATYWKKLREQPSIDSRVDTVLEWLHLPAEKRPHLITLYMSDVDGAGHRFGPDAPEVQSAVQAVDRSLGRLLDGIDSLPIRDRVYLVLVSDHGMAAYTTGQYMAIEDLIDPRDVRVADSGPNANLHVTGGPARARAVRDSLNRVLRHGRAYLRREIPARLHYRADPRIGDVVIIMDEPYQVGPAARAPSGPGGSHGWDPASSSMSAIFLAMGPGIKRGSRIRQVENIDIYPFLVELLGLRPNPGIDGHPGLVRRLIMEQQRVDGVPVGSQR